MRKPFRILTSLIVGCAVLTAPSARAQEIASPVSDQLRLFLESVPLPVELRLGGESVLAAQALPAFYAQRVYRPAWVSENGPMPAADQFLAVLKSVDDDGLRSQDYHLDRISRLLETTSGSSPSPAALAELDLLLTDACLMLGAHLVSGRVDPFDLDREWIAVRREIDLVAALEAALETGEVRAFLESLLPDHQGYFLLRDLGRRYRDLVAAGGWPPISEGPALRLGDSGSRVAELRQRLAVTGDLEADDSDLTETLFDEQLESAVRSFQARHGLGVDGVVGERSLAALNVTASERLEQIYLNLERWRWLPQSLGEHYVLVNLPAFDLRVVDGEATVLEMRVAVGRRYRRTPVFSDTIRYLVFNPYWEIPPSIAINDKLPEIRKDPSYFGKQGIRVLSGWGADQREIDPHTIDWSTLGRGNFPFRLRQDPGPLNALGRVKFMFPNSFNIYLHDTPGREVFDRPERDVSSGCIRVAKPLELAELLLSYNEDWQPGSSRQFLSDYRERTIRLDVPWPVHLLYWTAWVDEQGKAQFRADLYNRDDKLSKALAEGSGSDGL
ncbi:MAG: L,D-transpeptidase family protein [Acidobacteriota bacterium]